MRSYGRNVTELTETQMKLLRYAVALPAYFTGCLYALSVEWFDRGVEDVALVMARRKDSASKSTAPHEHNVRL